MWFVMIAKSIFTLSLRGPNTVCLGLRPPGLYIKVVNRLAWRWFLTCSRRASQCGAAAEGRTQDREVPGSKLACGPIRYTMAH